MRTLYMHTIGGHPAFWSERDGRLYLVSRGYRVTLHASLREIRRQRRATIASRRSRGLDGFELEYGHARVAVPNDVPTPAHAGRR